VIRFVEGGDVPLDQEVKRKMEWLKKEFATQGINDILPGGGKTSERCCNPACKSESGKLLVSIDQDDILLTCKEMFKMP
jgi:hypothetical protein